MVRLSRPRLDCTRKRRRQHSVSPPPIFLSFLLCLISYHGRHSCHGFGLVGPPSSSHRHIISPVSSSSRTDISHIRLFSTSASQAERNVDPSLNIKCRHLSTCSGCSVPTEESVIEVSAIDSAIRYFRTPSLRRTKKRDEDAERGIFEASPEENLFPIVLPTPVSGWRTQAKLAACPRPRVDPWSPAPPGCAFGLYRAGSHDVIPIPDCSVHHPSIERAVRYITEATGKCRIEAYDPEFRKGALRYVQLRVERRTGRVCATAVFHAPPNSPVAKAAGSRLTKTLVAMAAEDEKYEDGDAFWHSVWIHNNEGTGNAIFGRGEHRWSRLYGSEYLREYVAGTEDMRRENRNDDAGRDTKEGQQSRRPPLLYFTPSAFIQANAEGFDKICLAVSEAIPPGSAVTELYAGVGTIGLTALTYHGMRENNKSLKWLRCSDENPANERCFELSVRTLPPSISGRAPYSPPHKQSKKNVPRRRQKNSPPSHRRGPRPSSSSAVTYRTLSASDALYAGECLGSDVLVIDPPRKGLDEAVLAQICKPFDPKQPPTEGGDGAGTEIVAWKTNLCNDATTLVYVSCGFDALAKDTTKILSSNAGWSVESATGFVLFPGSNHVETLVVFRRKGRKKNKDAAGNKPPKKGRFGKRSDHNGGNRGERRERY